MDRAYRATSSVQALVLNRKHKRQKRVQILGIYGEKSEKHRLTEARITTWHKARVKKFAHRANGVYEKPSSSIVHSKTQI